MNVRGLASLADAVRGAQGGRAASKADDTPAFSLPEANAQDAPRMDRDSMRSAREDARRTIREEAPRAPHEARPRASDDGARKADETRDDNDRDARRDVDTPDASTRTGMRRAHARTAARREQDDAARPERDATVPADSATDASTPKPAAEQASTVEPDPSRADLPARMLALLEGAAPPVASSSLGHGGSAATGVAGISSTPMQPGGLIAGVGAFALATNGPMVEGAPLQANTTAQATQASPASPGVALPSAFLSTPATEAPFAALAALAAQAAPDPSATGARGERSDTMLVDTLTQASDVTPATANPLRTTVDAASSRVQFTVPIALPTRPELGFDDGFDQRIAWMADQRIGQAEMRVSPEGVGPIDVRLQVDGHRVTAQFNAANADVRQALEAGMDRLRDMLGQRGMELADAQVGQQRSQGDGRPGGAAPNADPAGDDAAPVTTVRALRARGLVDEYV